jgi:hypothetical protein
VVTILGLLLLISILPASDITSGERISLTDEEEDVVWSGFTQRKAGGHGEIDIISLESKESITDITVVLGMAEDISAEMGYLYTVSIGGIHVSYQEGTFEVWRWDNAVEPVDNVQTGIAQDEITVVLSKSKVQSPLVLNATAQMYLIDWVTGRTKENYFDKVGNFDEGSRAPAIGDYEFAYTDPEGDVYVSYRDEDIVDEPGLDIISVHVDRGDEVQVSLELGGPPEMEDVTRYIIVMGHLWVEISAGSARVYRDDRLEMTTDVDLSGNTMLVEVPLSLFEEDLGIIVAMAKREIDRDTYIIDQLPDDLSSVSELLPFAPGSRREIDIHVSSPSNVVMTRSYGGFSQAAAEAVRGSIDADGDGYVSSAEAEEIFPPVGGEGEEDDHLSDLRMDGRTGSLTIRVDHSGLIGDIYSNEDLSITWAFNFTFTPGSGDSHSLDVDIDYLDPGILIPSDEPMEEEVYRVKIWMGQGWRIDVLTLEPPELSNSADLQGTSVDHEFSGEDARDFDSGSIEFDMIRVSDSGETDDDEVEDDDGPTWLYIMILFVMILVVAGAVMWSRRED